MMRGKNATWKDIEDAEESVIINYTKSYDGKTFIVGDVERGTAQQIYLLLQEVGKPRIRSLHSQERVHISHGRLHPCCVRRASKTQREVRCPGGQLPSADTMSLL